ncbi:DUF2247 family protein [Xylocopilactobacillus apicola]|uniref:DUF2247 domain-containing protein n=1 Tax=Xylocopilactobacillus apicola TaxID=2932184 RepID=A0AAU9DPY6_9LACO|nr:DUF2247 family protein [Xylocopilactobacillus apicola]BDR59262.1 hypothetical protein XA3_17030 [Xylocopilactobacillus apicola]
MELSDFKEKGINYNWRTIYVGVIHHYFNFNVISKYAVELMEEGNDDDFVVELTWNVDANNVQVFLNKIKVKYFPDLEETSDDYKFEERKLRYIYLEDINTKIKNDDELLNKIAEYYDLHNYPPEMSTFINYMPQEPPTVKDDLINRFREFLDCEYKIVREN